MLRSQAMFLVGILAAGCASDDPDRCADASGEAVASWEEIVETQQRFGEWRALGCS